MSLFTPRRSCPTGGRHRAGQPRPWPVGWRRGVDPWADAPLFDVRLERQRRAAAYVTCGRAL